MPKPKKKIELKFNPHLPNEFVRKVFWSGSVKVFRNKKKYDRKNADKRTEE